MAFELENIVFNNTKSDSSQVFGYVQTFQIPYFVYLLK